MIAGGRPDLRRILVAYTVNELGTWFGYIALAVAVYDHTHSAIAVAGLFVSGRFLPALLVPALVARVEASTRRGELSSLYFLEGVASVALAVLLWHFWLPAVLLLVAIDGTAALTANALLRAAAARVEPESVTGAGLEQEAATALVQRKANASLNIAFTTTVAIGPAVAGLAVATLGGPAALLIDAGSFVICGLLLLDVRPHIEEMDGTTVRDRLAAAWVHLRQVPHMLTLLVTEAVAVVFFASVEPVEVLYAKATLHAGSRGFGVLVAAWGVGMVLGGLYFARSVRRPLGPMLTAGTALVGFAYIGFAAAPSLLVACAAAVVGGAGNGVQWASLISAVQHLTPNRLQGQLMSTVQSINALCPAIGFALGGVVAALTSPRGAMLMAGIVATLATAVFFRLTTRDTLRTAIGRAPHPRGWPEQQPVNVLPHAVESPALINSEG